ncbi:MAG: hypothetical protein IT445_07490 [Phycisphaeraceae bacterium]|nr:hypothetical protein [Phycisphaeraceae bacterium]
MRIAIEWIKSNVVSVISIIVVMLSLGFLGWVHLQGSKFREQLGQREAVITSLNAYTSASVQVPGPRPDAPPDSISGVTINQDVIDKLSTMYDGMAEQYDGVYQRAVEYNKRYHDPLLPGLFPKWDENNFEIPFQARYEYVKSFFDMFEPSDPQQPEAPRLDAGSPPSPQDIQINLSIVERDFVSNVTNTQLTESDQKDLEQEMRDKLIDMLHQKAAQIHIYANKELVPGQTYGGQLQQYDQFPFQVESWAFLDTAPLPHQLWEGQLELWMQQDIIRAIAKVNQVNDPKANVITAPVKRLMGIQIVPGYIGLHTLGAASNGQFASAQRTDGSFGPPIAAQRTNDPTQATSNNFFVGPTGRVSNALYDVRQVVLTVAVDYARLNQLIAAINSVNFMTVLNVQIENIDEYEGLQQGYFYGPDDVVTATMVIETIWLRDWTQPLMPDRVRSYVGIDEPELDTGPGGGYMDFGGGMEDFEEFVQ